MAGPEAKIERIAVSEMRERFGVRTLKFSSPGETGVPDRIIFVPGGRPLLMEFKRPGGVISAKQEYWIELLILLGYDALIVDSVEEAIIAVEKRIP